MKTILSILDEISSTTSTKEKQAILEREKSNTLLKDVFIATYHPHINYGIKAIPPYDISTASLPISLPECLLELNTLSSRKYSGGAAIFFLQYLLGALSEEDSNILERIIQRDLRCGCSDTIAAKVWKGLVPIHDVMLCSSDMSTIKYPAVVDVKSDGMRVSGYYDGASLKLTSRQGKPVECFDVFDISCEKLVTGSSIDGELVFYKDGKPLDRKTSNGLGIKAVRGTLSQDEAKMAVLHVWDLIDYSGIISYSKRRESLYNTFKPDSNIRQVKSIIAESEEDAYKFYDECIQAGEEGVVVKNLDAVWEGKRSKDCVKIKQLQTADLIVTALEEGTGKNSGRLGALVCETSDGLLRVRIGIFKGYDDSIRDDLYKSDTIGTIVEAQYNQKIVDKKTGIWSLFLPRYIGTRLPEDKKIANTLMEVL